MDFRVLGPWEVTGPDGPVVVPAGHLRVLLAAFLVSGGRPMRIDALAEQVWTEQLPADARGTLATYVSRLRRLLGNGRILTCSGIGYRIDLPTGAVDLFRFRDALDGARKAASVDEELALLREALGLWRGQPFTGVDSTWIDRDVVPKLTEEWFTATERRVDLELARGRSGALVAELWDLTNTYPLRESLWFRLITALHRSGRRADALAAYQRVRTLLGDELGIDPGDELQRLHHAVLVDGTVSTPSPPKQEARTGPHQLPHDNARFTGRESDLHALDALLADQSTMDSPDGAQGNAPTTIVAIDGAAGTGKTTLALHWAHRVRDRFPDVQLYLNLRGFSSGEPVKAAAALESVLRALGVSNEHMPAEIDERAAMLRSCLAGRRAMIVLDNARDAQQVRPLLPGSGSLVVVTSRNQLRPLSIRDGAHRVTLRRLGHAEALTLLGVGVGVDRVRAEPEASARLVDLCDRLPLALAIVAERAQRAGSLAEVVHALADEVARLDNFGAGADDPYTDLRAALSWSYHTLEPGAAAVFRKLGLYPANDITVEAVAALADLPVARAKLALDQLVAAHMVEQRRPERYELHDLIRLYASDEARRNESAAESEPALNRVFDWYLHAVISADTVLMPHRRRAFVEPYQAMRPVPEFADHDTAMRWFEQEYECLRSAVTWGASHGWGAYAWRIAIGMTSFLERHIPWPEGLEFLEIACRAARSAGDRTGEAYTLNSLGCFHLDQAEWATAQHYFRLAHACFRDVGDRRGQGMALGNLGMAHTSMGDPGNGIRYGTEALERCREVGYKRGVALNLDSVGMAHCVAGDHERAMECHLQASVLFTELADPDEGPRNDHNLGRAYAASGRYASAIKSLGKALRAFRRVGNRRWEAIVYVDLAKTLNAAGHPGLARGCWESAMVVMKQLGDPRAQDIEEIIATAPPEVAAAALDVFSGQPFPVGPAAKTGNAGEGKASRPRTPRLTAVPTTEDGYQVRAFPA